MFSRVLNYTFPREVSGAICVLRLIAIEHGSNGSSGMEKNKVPGQSTKALQDTGSPVTPVFGCFLAHEQAGTGAAGGRVPACPALQGTRDPCPREVGQIQFDWRCSVPEGEPHRGGVGGTATQQGFLLHRGQTSSRLVKRRPGPAARKVPVTAPRRCDCPETGRSGCGVARVHANWELTRWTDDLIHRMRVPSVPLGV